VAEITVNRDRLALSRLVHRFGFGPKPGEFKSLLSMGFTRAQTKLLNPPASDLGLSAIPILDFPDRGAFPPAKTPERLAFTANMQADRLALELWWLDRMALADHCLTERLTWFWHGHWATSLGKVEYARPMKAQNETLRKFAIGNFRDQAQAMVIDPALMYWLDAGSNVKTGPNENLSRELMELFTVGVGRYKEVDVKAMARALTGYTVNRSAGTFTFYPKRHDESSFTIFESTGTWNAAQVIDLLVARDDNRSFITDRLWFRFMSTALAKPTEIESAFTSREILPAVKKIATYLTTADVGMGQVKSPVEWFVSLCRALKITPSAVNNPKQVINYLEKLGQVPFNPPNVGGWPSDEAWLNVASTQYRIAFLGILIGQADLSPITGLNGAQMEVALADWLGISEFSARTKAVFNDPGLTTAQIVTIALSSPEYLVNG
jgi:uncharacterized protein (DUF1800 family)